MTRATWRRALAPLVVLAACADDPAPPPAIDSAPPPVVRAPVAPPPPRYVGVVTTTVAVDVAPTIEAALTRVTVRPGDEVSEGQVIAELDPRAVRRDLAIGEAALAEARAGLRAGEVNVRDAARVLASERRAVAAGVSPARAAEDAAGALARARADRDRASAAVAEARARVDALRVLVDDTAIRAPFAGVIALRYRDVGDAAGPRSPVVRLVKREGLRLRFGVPPADARTLRPGQRVTAQLDTIPAPITATIEQIAPTIDTPSRLVFVDATLDAADDALQPGLAAHVTVP